MASGLRFPGWLPEIFVLILLQATAAQAQHVVCSKGMKARSCELLAEPVEQQLKVLAAPGDWQWVVLDEKDWRQATGRFHVAEQSANAFTVLQLRITFLSEEYLQRNRPLPVLDVLAHELGHIRCVCGSEQEAARLGTEILVAHYNADRKRMARP